MVKLLPFVCNLAVAGAPAPKVNACGVVALSAPAFATRTTPSLMVRPPVNVLPPAVEGAVRVTLVPDNIVFV